MTQVLGVRRARLVALGPAIVAAVAFALPVTALALLVRRSVDQVVRADQDAIRAATDVTRDHPGLRDALLLWQEVFQPLNVYVVATVACVLVWRTGLRSRAVWAFVTMMASWSIALGLKLIVQRVRPVIDDPVSAAPGFSFPSGHVANAAAASAVMVILLWPLLRSRVSRVAAVLLAAGVVVLTCLDRIYLGVHFPSDATAGVLLGVGLAVSSFLAFRGWGRYRDEQGADQP